MKEIKLRGMIGNSILILSSVMMVAFIALPMLVATNGGPVYSIAQSMFNLVAISKDLGTNITYYLVSSAFMISFLVFAVSLLILSILSLIGMCKDNIKLNMTIANRAITLINAVICSISIIFLVFYHQANEVVTTALGYGLFLEIAAAFLGVVASFVAPSRNFYKNF